MRTLQHPQQTRRFLRALLRGARQLALGIDAASTIALGLEVPPDHGARNTSSPTGDEHTRR